MFKWGSQLAADKYLGQDDKYLGQDDKYLSQDDKYLGQDDKSLMLLLIIVNDNDMLSLYFQC